MNMLKTAILGASALAIAGAMNAETVKITGSTAFRKAAYAAIISQLSAGGTVKAAYVGSALSSANQAVFSNNTDTVICCMAGSVGGVNWVSNQLPVATSLTADPASAWLNVSYSAMAACSIDTTNKSVTGGAAVAGPFSAASSADATMSDSFQDSTPFPASTPAKKLADLGNGVGGVAFVIAKGQKHPNVPQASYDRLTGMTNLQFQALSTSGYAPLQFFTGNAADANIDVVIVGRDSDSGTRLAAFAESGVGGVASAALAYRAYNNTNTDAGLNNSQSTVIEKLVFAGLDAANPDNQLSDPTISGYPSGGNVKNVLLSDIAAAATDDNGNPFIIVGYLGSADSQPTLPASGKQAVTPLLTWNGVPYTNAAISLGQYSFWTAEHLYAKPAQAANAILNGIAQKIGATYAPYAKGLLKSELANVSRSGEGKVVTPLYP